MVPPASAIAFGRPTLGMCGDVAGAMSARLFTRRIRSANWARASDILMSMRERALRPTVTHHNALLGVFSAGSRWMSALRHLGAMREAAVRPNVISFNSALAACGKVGAIDVVAALLGGMSREAVAPDDTSYVSSLVAVGRFDRRGAPQVDPTFGGVLPLGPKLAVAPEAALALLELLRRRGFRPGVVLHNFAMDACRKASRFDMALQVLESACRQGLRPTTVSCNIALSACERAGQGSSALLLLRSMHAAGPRPDAISWNTAISASGKASHCAEALRLLRAAPAPDLVAFNAAISACERSHRHRDAVRLLRSACRSCLQADAVSYGAAMSACEKALLWWRALSLFREMDAHAVRRDAAVQSSAVAAAAVAVAWELALSLVSQHSSRDCHNALLDALGRGNLWASQLRALAAMRDQGVAPDDVSHASVVGGLARASKWRLALEAVPLAGSAALQAVRAAAVLHLHCAASERLACLSDDIAPPRDAHRTVFIARGIVEAPPGECGIFATAALALVPHGLAALRDQNQSASFLLGSAGIGAAGARTMSELGARFAATGVRRLKREEVMARPQGLARLRSVVALPLPLSVVDSVALWRNAWSGLMLSGMRERHSSGARATRPPGVQLHRAPGTPPRSCHRCPISAPCSALLWAGTLTVKRILSLCIRYGPSGSPRCTQAAAWSRLRQRYHKSRLECVPPVCPPRAVSTICSPPSANPTPMQIRQPCCASRPPQQRSGGQDHLSLAEGRRDRFVCGALRETGRNSELRAVGGLVQRKHRVVRRARPIDDRGPPSSAVHVRRES